MSQTHEIRILQTTDLENIQTFERAQIVAAKVDPIEAELASWTAPWRSESLNHYLPQGWSFAAFTSNKEIVGYLIAQPILFYKCQTQTVWVEHLAAQDENVAQKLSEVIWRWCRDKHMQKLIFNDAKVGSLIQHSIGGELIGDAWEVSTTRSKMR